MLDKLNGKYFSRQIEHDQFVPAQIKSIELVDGSNSDELIRMNGLYAVVSILSEDLAKTDHIKLLPVKWLMACDFYDKLTELDMAMNGNDNRSKYLDNKRWGTR